MARSTKSGPMRIFAAFRHPTNKVLQIQAFADTFLITDKGQEILETAESKLSGFALSGTHGGAYLVANEEDGSRAKTPERAWEIVNLAAKAGKI